MLAVAAQLDLVARLLAVVAAVLPVRPVRRDDALAAWMRALVSGFSHNAPPRQHSTPMRHPAAIRLICAVLAVVSAGAPGAAPFDLAQGRQPVQGDFRETLAR